MRTLFVILLALLISFSCTFFPAYAEEPKSEKETELDYTKIPGVTQEEKDAIKAIQVSGRTFTYATILSTESFIDEKGNHAGYAPRLCEILTDLFDIKFTPEIYDWATLFNGINDKSLDFTGEFTINPSRRKSYSMSQPIAVRTLSVFYLADGESIEEIAKTRTPVIGFLNDTVHESQVNGVYTGPFQSHYFESIEAAGQGLNAKVVDAFVSDNVAAPFFESDKVVDKIFSPIVCSSVALSTKNTENDAIISVFNKYMANGGQDELATQYDEGISDYTRSVLYNSFTQSEKDYIDSYVEANKKIPIILESGNYPISFYNEKSKEYQGIVPDILKEITVLTHLEFEAINAPEEDWGTVLAKLQNGEAKIISELLHTPARDGQFLWPDEPSCVTNYALLSTSDAPNLSIYQLLGKRIGVEIDTAYQDIAIQWFPDVELITCNSIEETFEALDKGDIDLIMASENLLLSQTNYSEKPGYKVNLTIDHTAESKLGFNIEEEVLLSIFNKTYPLTETSQIVGNWRTKVFDYSAQLSQARASLFTISTILLAAFIILLIIFLAKNNRNRKDLSSIVQARTAELEEKTTTLSTIYNSIPDMLFSKDTDGRFTSCNPSFEIYAGLPESEIVGKLPSEIFDEDELLAFETIGNKPTIGAEAETADISEQKVTFPNGEERLLETIKTSLKQNDENVGMLAISRDITAHKEAEEAAQTASKAKGAFLARMSHEIRTPLNAIIGMAEISKAAVDDKVKTVSSVNQIIVSSRHLLSLINDVLDMSKIESGNLELVNEPFKLNTAFEETLTIVSARCKDKGIDFRNNISSLPNMVVTGDKLRLNQVLINLLSNATKFTAEDGIITFNANTMAETAEKIRIRFSVKDSGIGMSEEQMSRLFKPFEQADSTIASRFGGTGLGLSISQNLVQQMGGNISIASKLGDGSEFTFDIVFRKSDSSPESLTETHVETPDLTGHRILLADDIEINRMIVVELLEPTNVIIEEATNGREAKEMFEKSEPGYYKLIFMDVQMPVMGGYEATTTIRNLDHEEAKTIPIIAMTANAYKEDVDQSLASGMNAHLGKPLDMNEVMRTLTKYIKEN